MAFVCHKSHIDDDGTPVTRLVCFPHHLEVQPRKQGTALRYVVILSGLPNTENAYRIAIIDSLPYMTPSRADVMFLKFLAASWCFSFDESDPLDIAVDAHLQFIDIEYFKTVEDVPSF